MPEFNYIGSELEIFEHARRWKSYWRSRVERFITGDVLEVGAGIGANTSVLSGVPHRSWVCVEPDADLARQIGPQSPHQELIVGTLRTLPGGRRFDTILYVDVLEHIEEDTGELELAASHLNTGGHLVVLAPAHQFLYTAFDRAVGHHRRYTRGSLRAIAPRTLREVRLEYLDAVGVMASLANRLVLRSAYPTLRQIRTWDSLMVPCSRVLDPLLQRQVGKSVLGVWQRHR